jgi:hypothetical protein
MLSGRIVDIWTEEKDTQGDPVPAFSFAVVERFQISPTLHPEFGMPILVRAFGETMNVVVSTKVCASLGT